jgi:ABC-type sugar transport system permease subunit
MAHIALSSSRSYDNRRAQPSYRRSVLLPLAFLLPTIVVLLILQVYPAIYAMFLSTTRLRRGVAEPMELRNYERLFQTPSFLDGLGHTATYALSFLFITVVVGMFLALLLNRRIRFTGFYLVILFIPWVLSDVVAGTMWRWLFQPQYGILQEWLYQVFPALDAVYTDQTGSMVIVILASAWQALAYTTILSLGALQTVPNEIIESAALDGANRFQRFFGIILPIIRPTLLVMILLVSIRAINSVGLIYATTGGGPGRATQTASIYLLITGWRQGEFGLGAAVSVVLLVVNIALTLFYLTLIGRKRE